MNAVLFHDLTPNITTIEFVDLILMLTSAIFGILNVMRAVDERRSLRDSGMNGFLDYLQRYILVKEVILLFVCLPAAFFTYLQSIVPSPQVPTPTYEAQQIAYLVLSLALTCNSFYKYSMNRKVSELARKYYEENKL